jgi:hypothetical protein
MKLTDLLLNRFLYKDTSQNLETKDSVFVSADSTPASPAPIASGGAAQDINVSNVQINGAQLEPGSIPPETLDVSNWGWGQTCAFTSTDADTVSWGAGTFTSANGVSYSISAGNTGDMVAKTYIYLSLNDSKTAYQTTTTPSEAVGLGKVLVAVAQNAAVNATYNLSEATQIVGDNILANSINASKLQAGTVAVDVYLSVGSGDNIFKSDAAGISLGNANFADAPFNVDMGGNCKVSSLARSDFHWFTVFESVDGYSKITDGTGLITASASGVIVSTGNLTDNDSQIKKDLGGQMTWNKNRKFKCEIIPTNNSNQEIYIVTGTASGANPASAQHFGFLLNGAQIYATVCDGNNRYETELFTFSAGSTYVLEAILNAATGIITYYVNGTLWLTGDGDGTPTGTAEAGYAFTIQARTKADVVKTVTANWLDFWQAN